LKHIIAIHHSFNQIMRTSGIYEADVFRQLNRIAHRFNCMRCLDIGTRDGLNCLTLSKLGAKEVVGVDLDDTHFDSLTPDQLRIYNISLIKGDVLAYFPEEPFDVVTCFLWNMPLPQYTAIAEKIKSLLKPGGRIFVGVHDQIYKTGYIDRCSGRALPNSGCVAELLSRHFADVSILQPTSSYQWIIKATVPLNQ